MVHVAIPVRTVGVRRIKKKVNTSDISITENYTETEMINISKTFTETNTEKIF
jgi:hypothetical protein